jgi:sec-independent protein translocase protein TatB
MIDIAWSQFLIILLLAVILLGPKELPIVLRTLGKWYVVIRSHLQDLQDYIKAVSHVDQVDSAPDKKKFDKPTASNHD